MHNGGGAANAGGIAHRGAAELHDLEGEGGIGIGSFLAQAQADSWQGEMAGSVTRC